MKKVLIITYYWPPSGGSGVQRWLKFVKYLPQFGYEPHVYTVENGEYPVLDMSLEKDIPKEAVIIKKTIWEPYTFYKKFTGQKKDSKLGHGFVGVKKKGGLKQKLHEIAVWIRGNFFIPDSRIFWVKPSTQFLSEYIQKHQIDTVISTGTPHSLHLIALALKKKYQIKWIADFRDPWSGVYYLKSMKLSKRSMQKHLKLEREVLLNCDRVITVGEHMKKNLAALISDQNILDKISVISNGYDFEFHPHVSNDTDKKFSIVYIGLFSKEQNHPQFWKALQECVKENEEFCKHLELKFVGNIDRSIEEAIAENGLATFYNGVGFVSHHEAIALQHSAQVLLLSINNYEGAKEMLTGKIFEYISSGRPILCLGPKDGDAAAVIYSTNTGVVCEWDDKEMIKKALCDYFEAYRTNTLKVDGRNIEDYHRKNLTKKLVTYIQQL